MARPTNPNSKRQQEKKRKEEETAAGTRKGRGRPSNPQGVRGLQREKSAQINEHKNSIRALIEKIAHPVLTVGRNSKLAAKSVEWINALVNSSNAKLPVLANVAHTLREIDLENVQPRKQGKGLVHNINKGQLQHRVKNYNNPLQGYDFEVTPHHVRVVDDPAARRKMAQDAINGLTREERLARTMAIELKKKTKKANIHWNVIQKDLADSFASIAKAKGPTFRFLSARPGFQQGFHTKNWTFHDVPRIAIDLLNRSKLITPSTKAHFIIKANITLLVLDDVIGEWKTADGYPKWVSLNKKDSQFVIKPPFNDAELASKMTDIIKRYDDEHIPGRHVSDGQTMHYLIHEIVLDTWFQGSTNAGGCLVGNKDKVAMFGSYKTRSFRSTNNNCLIACLNAATDKKLDG